MKPMNDRRYFFKSLAMLGAAAVGCPGIFIPKFQPVKWKVSQSIANTHWTDPKRVFGKWQFIQTTYHLKGEMWVPDDKVNFAPYPDVGSFPGLRSGVVKFDTVPIVASW